jgi:hypothetical protein
MSDQHPSDLGAIAATLLERYRQDEARLEREIDALQIRLEITREVIAGLSGKRVTRQRNPQRRWPVISETSPDLHPDATDTPPSAA